jgi:hypothetical protein
LCTTQDDDDDGGGGGGCGGGDDDDDDDDDDNDDDDDDDNITGAYRALARGDDIYRCDKSANTVHKESAIKCGLSK